MTAREYGRRDGAWTEPEAATKEPPQAREGAVSSDGRASAPIEHSVIREYGDRDDAWTEPEAATKEQPQAREGIVSSGRRASESKEYGQATIFVVAFAVVFLVLAGLVVDGGLALNARQRVADDVEQAARAGSQRLDVAELRNNGKVEIDQGAAEVAARRFLIARGYPADKITVTPAADEVTVRATIEQPTALLSLVFFDHFTVTAQGQARPAVGITGEVTP